MKQLASIALATAVALLVVALQPACYYDNETELYPGGTNCDTAGIKYSVQIKQILDNNCTICHSPSGGTSPDFTAFSGVKSSATDGKLVNRTNNSTSPMPPTGLLPDCDREKIKAWVNAGALDN